jgi:hypothetical protein
MEFGRRGTNCRRDSLLERQSMELDTSGRIRTDNLTEDDFDRLQQKIIPKSKFRDPKSNRNRRFYQIWQNLFLKRDEIFPHIRVAYRGKSKAEYDAFAAFY